MADAAPSGTIADTVARLALWCRRADHGFIRAIFHDGRAREAAVQQLEKQLVRRNLSFQRLDLPAAASADALALRLADELARLGPGVVSLTGFERSLPTSGPALEAALLALNSRRENFAVSGQHTIWWFPRHIAQALIREHRDLNSWFLRRVELTETISSATEIELDSLGDEAIRLSNAAEYAEAEPLLRKIVATQEASYGPDDFRLAPALFNLASLLHATSRFAEAESLFRRTLRLQEEKHGPSHTITAFGLNSLASLLKDTSRFAEAEILLRRALAINEGSLGPHHPRVAAALNNLSQLLSETGRPAEAEPLLRRALAVQETALGPNHTDVAAAAVNLGALLLDAEQFDEAERLFRRGLAIHEDSFGLNHPSVATTLNSLANLLQHTGRHSEAEELMRRALAIDEARLGVSHPDVANRLHNLGLFVLEAGRTKEAKSLLQRSLCILASSSSSAGHSVAGLKTASQSYRHLLHDLGVKRPEAERQMVELLMEHGLTRKKSKQLART